MNQSLYQSIFRRKACRTYDMTPLSDELLDEIDSVLTSFVRLYEQDTLSYRIVSRVKGLFHVAAPHYLIISGEGSEGEEESAGFLFEQLALWLNSQNLGSVWLGASRDGEGRNQKGDLIVIGFGKPADSPHRGREQFKRKPLNDVTNDVNDSLIQAAALAPSGLNKQPWYFHKEEDRVLVYLQNLKAPLSLLYTLTRIDIGIALAHYMLACNEEGKSFMFIPSSELPPLRGYTSFGIIKSDLLQ